MKNPFRFFSRKSLIDRLLEAIEIGDPKKISDLLLRNPDLAGQKNKYGMSPLMYAVLRGSQESTKVLLEKGANPNQIHEHGSTPLMVSVLEEQIEILPLLLAHPQILLDRQDLHGATALMYACRQGRINLMTLLLEAGADPNLRDVEGETALMYAVGLNQVELIEILLLHGAEVGIKNFDGLSVIDKTRDEGIIRLLERHSH